jgi:hypothetical protein
MESCMKKPKIDLCTAEWAARFGRTLALPDGPIDMWVIHHGEANTALVTLGVPHGRADIVDFVVRSCRAGQNVLLAIRSEEPYVVGEAYPGDKSILS